jgi:hypothetical protein
LAPHTAHREEGLGRGLGRLAAGSREELQAELRAEKAELKRLQQHRDEH